MTDQPGQSGRDDAGEPAASSDPGGDPSGPLDFDPYRFGKPDYPIPPEYAPPGYVPPAPTPAEPVWPPKDAPTQPGYGQQPSYPSPYVAQPYGGQPPYGGYPPGYPPDKGGYGGYSPHPPPPPGYPAYGRVRTGNGKATTAMVLGILALLFFWLTVIDLALAIPAIVFGALAIRDAKHFPDRDGRGKGLAGVICGSIALVLIIVMIAVVYVRIEPCLNYGFSSDRYQSCVNQRI